MSIAATALYEDAAAQIGAGVGNDRLTRAFKRAVNRSLDELSIAADLATPLTHIDDVDDVIDLDDNYEHILYAGVLFHLVRAGHLPGDPRLAKALLEDTRVGWAMARGEYVMAEDNDNQATATNDVWGLGYLGDS
jgi:hypothetical protein